MAFTQDDKERFVLHIAYHMGSGSDGLVTELSLPFTADSTSTVSTWQQALLAEQATFSKDNNLTRTADTRTHGLCTSPLGDAIAINISHHPSEGVEYATNSDQISSVIMSSTKEDEQSGMLSSGSPSHPYGEDFILGIEHALTICRNHGRGLTFQFTVHLDTTVPREHRSGLPACSCS